MFMPGYRAPAAPEYDWRAQKQMLQLVGKRPDPVQIQEDREAQQSTLDRFRQADEARQRGASREEIRLIMEA